MKRHLRSLLCVVLCLPAVLAACGGQKKRSAAPMPQNTAPMPVFSADSAYRFVAQQLQFGPRVPNTQAHRDCGDFFVEKLKAYGAVVTEQKDVVTACDGTPLQMRNIIASYCPEATRRIFVAAHWDCRPWCDQDAATHHHTPVPGANDGASGAAVLLELARGLQQLFADGSRHSLGVDLIFFDAEDYGSPSWESAGGENTWCLGSQYWAKRPHKAGYTAEYGILLDMVGGRHPGFFQEYYSMRYAPDVVQKVWAKASELGYGGTFIDRRGGAITDDHLYVNRLAHIPCIDIIDFDDSLLGGFPATWHTTKDNLEHIEAESLKRVGETVLAVICDEM